MMVVVEGRRPLCWACKQLGYIARTCPHKTAATGTTTSTATSTRTTTSIISIAALKPEVRSDNQEKWPTLVTRKKWQPHFQQQNQLKTHTSDNNRSDNRNYHSLGNINWLHNHSTFIIPQKAKKKGKKKDHRGGTAWRDGNLSKLKKRRKSGETQAKKLCILTNPLPEKLEKQTMKKTKEKPPEKKPSKVPFFSTASSPKKLPWKRKTTP